jgi:hypothetical protein
VDVFESLYGEIVKSGWTEDQLCELAVRVKNSKCENPGAIFMWRLRNQKPPRAHRPASSSYAMPAEEQSCDELEIPDEVYDAWEKTLSQLSIMLNKANYSTWVEPLSIARYNGSLVLHAANSTVFEELRKLNYDEKMLENIFAKHLGQTVPVEFEVGR